MPAYIILIHLLFYLIKPQNYNENKTPFQFLFVVKAIALKQQISYFYPHILNTKANVYVYGRPLR